MFVPVPSPIALIANLSVTLVSFSLLFFFFYQSLSWLAHQLALAYLMLALTLLFPMNSNLAWLQFQPYFLASAKVSLSSQLTTAYLALTLLLAITSNLGLASFSHILQLALLTVSPHHRQL